MIVNQPRAQSPWRLLALLGFLASASIGCGDKAPYGLAQVSGAVTLDGKPVPYTQVTFMPKSGDGNPNPGPGSAATCDDNGRFQLTTVRGEQGAVVGPHTVRISSTGPPRPPTNSDLSTGPLPKDAFPDRFNVNSELTFEVPAGGTTAADFKLTTAP
jgi:hypothetical protein